MKGRLHSIETMGLVDGPGIRSVIFLQGCPLRCAYCHNPDSQNMFSNKEISPEEVLKLAKRYKIYYDKSGGGITFSGGEPLLQGEFLIEALKLLKENGFNTTVDTSGYGNEKHFREILKYVDTLILDIKHFNNKGYKSLTGAPMSGFYKFLSYLDNFKGKIWIRHVMVPGITDNEEAIKELFNNIGHLAHKIDRIEVLPYHTMAVEKYDSLGIEYSLKDVPEMNADKAMEYQKMLSDMLIIEKERATKHKKII